MSNERAQCDLILEHLQAGKRLTPIEALKTWGVFRLGARIHDLRARGHKITTELQVEGKKQFACYFMEEAATLFDQQVEEQWRIMEHELNMEERQ